LLWHLKHGQLMRDKAAGKRWGTYAHRSLSHVIGA
jgi:hypothetical protein